MQLLVCVLIALSCLTLAGYVNAITDHSNRAERLVTFHDRGEEHVVLTNATTVVEALSDANMVVEPQDVVEPTLGSELFSTDSAVIIYRSRQVIVVDGALRQKVVTSAAAPSEIVAAAGIDPIRNNDEATITKGNFVTDGASAILTITRGSLTPNKIGYKPLPNALTKSRGAQIFTDSNGVAHRETYYDLPMNVVMRHCGGGDYTIREQDGAKIDQDGYILVAANYRIYPKCSIVETSMGPGKVYDTGGFALRYPHGFDLATDWSNNNGR